MTRSARLFALVQLIGLAAAVDARAEDQTPSEGAETKTSCDSSKSKMASPKESPRVLATKDPIFDDRFTFYTENDKWAWRGDDRYYTQGIKASLITTRLPELWPDNGYLLPFFDSRTHDVGITAGQNMYTPVDLQRRDPILNDRPYGGWLYVGLVTHRWNRYDNTTPFEENIEVDMGVIGRSSMAEDTQIDWHRLWHIDTPKGWTHQIKDEFGFLLSYKRTWEVEAVKGALAATPHVGFRGGNVFTQPTLGCGLRFGYKVPCLLAGTEPVSGLDAAVNRMRPPPEDYRLYGTIEADGRLSVFNVFLDGNLTRKSQHIAKEYFVADVEARLYFEYHDWFRFSYGYIFRTKEFKGQGRESTFGSFEFSFTR